MMNLDRRAELSDFLRKRRARTSPEEVGLASSSRRRTPGLRREEVALLANIGATWYTRLEQGLPINVSSAVLDNISQALRLSRDERCHLYALAGHAGDAPVAEVAESVTDAQRRVLDALDPNPAYIIGRRWDVLAQNNATSAVLGDYASASGYGCNMLWRFFMERSQREFVSDWDRLARTLVAKFRAVAAHYSADPAFGALVGELLETSSEFRKLWAQHDVVRILGGLKVYNHPVVGELMLEYTTLMVPDFPDMRMMVYTPARGSESEHKLRDLVASYGKFAVPA